MSNPQFRDINGVLYNIAGAVPVPVAPTIPASAIAVIVDPLQNWKQEWDDGTSGSASNIASVYAAATGRNFTADYTKNAGVRWSNSFAKDATSNHYCYDLYVMLDDPSQIANLELDISQVMPDGRTAFICLQAASGSGTWEYTTTPNGKTHWNKSNIAVNPKTWPAKQWQRIRLFHHRDANGVVTYDGVEFNGVYTQFVNASGLSAIPLGWGAASFLINFQLDGAASTSGKLNATGKLITIYRWTA